ncbi:hypothetical protein C8F04DRAFT_735190 [Mycena alexandri]|uniref:Uncharacterized protein n=1 Tax=Mycena alexandri TaxID=1745969 RepID=A0AAD6WWQ9_9AGAR|nr:hypothetical protein C8F04DRAFT_735190 [Mycena alexandri]
MPPHPEPSRRRGWRMPDPYVRLPFPLSPVNPQDSVSNNTPHHYPTSLRAPGASKFPQARPQPRVGINHRICKRTHRSITSPSGSASALSAARQRRPSPAPHAPPARAPVLAPPTRAQPRRILPPSQPPYPPRPHSHLPTPPSVVFLPASKGRENTRKRTCSRASHRVHAFLLATHPFTFFPLWPAPRARTFTLTSPPHPHPHPASQPYPHSCLHTPRSAIRLRAVHRQQHEQRRDELGYERGPLPAPGTV